MAKTFTIGKGSPFKPAALGLSKLSRALSGTDAPGMKAAAKILRKTWSKVLSSRGAGRPSRPGEPPRRQTGRLAKSVAEGPTETGRIVAVLRYTGPILEAGVDTALPPRRGTKRRRKAGQARRQLKIAPRPSAQRAIDLATPAMQRALVDDGFESLRTVLGG